MRILRAPAPQDLAAPGPVPHALAPQVPAPQVPAPRAPAPQAPAPQASAPQASAPRAPALQAPALQDSAPPAPALQALAPQAPRLEPHLSLIFAACRFPHCVCKYCIRSGAALRTYSWATAQFGLRSTSLLKGSADPSASLASNFSLCSTTETTHASQSSRVACRNWTLCIPTFCALLSHATHRHWLRSRSDKTFLCWSVFSDSVGLPIVQARESADTTYTAQH